MEQLTKLVLPADVNIGDQVLFGKSPLTVLEKSIRRDRVYLHFGPELLYGSKTPVSVVIRG